MKNLLIFGASVAAAAALSAPTFAQCGTGTTTTTFAGGNAFAGNMFDINVGASDMTIECFDMHHNTAGNLLDIDLWYCPTTCVGNDQNPAAWTLISSVTGIVSAGPGVPTNVDISGNGVVFSAGTSYGIYMDLVNYSSAGSIAYTNGVGGVGALYPGDDCDIKAEYGKGTPSFTGSTFFPREWNGTLYTAAGSAGPNLSLTCAAGVVTADMAGFTAGSAIAIVYGPPAAYVHGGNQCNGIALDLTPTGAPLIVGADAAGAAQYVRNVPAAACGGGLLVQAVDAATCTASNSAGL